MDWHLLITILIALFFIVFICILLALKPNTMHLFKNQTSLISASWIDGTLHIQFAMGDKYAYKDVPYAVYRDLTETDDPAKLFKDRIRNEYDAE